MSEYFGIGFVVVVLLALFIERRQCRARDEREGRRVLKPGSKMDIDGSDVCWFAQAYADPEGGLRVVVVRQDGRLGDVKADRVQLVL